MVTNSKQKRYWCRDCWSDRLVKHGFVAGTDIQRYRCMKCGLVSTDRIDSFTDWKALSVVWAWWKAGQDVKEPSLSLVKMIDHVVTARLACGNPELSPETWPGIIEEALQNREEVNQVEENENH